MVGGGAYILEVVQQVSHGFALRVSEDIVVVDLGAACVQMVWSAVKQEQERAQSHCLGVLLPQQKKILLHRLAIFRLCRVSGCEHQRPQRALVVGGSYRRVLQLSCCSARHVTVWTGAMFSIGCEFQGTKMWSCEKSDAAGGQAKFAMRARVSRKLQCRGWQ